MDDSNCAEQLLSWTAELPIARLLEPTIRRSNQERLSAQFFYTGVFYTQLVLQSDFKQDVFTPHSQAREKSYSRVRALHPRVTHRTPTSLIATRVPVAFFECNLGT